ncbi:MAG: ferredoxin family protein [Chthonomonadales bacterium]|nr:ferredoxin family protein [Chthonomonadales bacterium]
MAYVVSAGCNQDGKCVEVCPSEAVEAGHFVDADGTVYDQMFIDPDECIECGNCESECPEAVIYNETDLPAGQEEYARINREYHAGK